MTEIRPWGSYTILDGDDYTTHKVKRIEVNPLQRLSLQSHKHRTEYWTVVCGSGRVQLDDESIDVSAGSTVHIKKEQIHRMENTSNSEVLVFIEVQLGTYLGEDDIVRYEDDYNRAT